MMTVILETFGQGTDIDHIIRFEHNHGRNEDSLFIHLDIEQIELCTIPS